MTQLWQMTAAEIAGHVRAKAVSATEVTQAHLTRLADVNPKINAVVQEFPDEALREAARVDAALARGEDPGPLCGVPVTIKENVDQTGQVNSGGVRLFKDRVAETDSPVVANVRKAGAVIVGRTNTPAFLIRWFSNNLLYGQTLNPLNRAITPGGSSGGAAAAVAAGIAPIGHGTDIAGSIRYPAYACGIHGLRPSLGRVPAYNASAPDRYISAQIMAVSGPMARTIADLELSLAAMSAPGPRDPWYVAMPLKGPDFPKRAAMTLAPDDMPVDDAVAAAVVAAAEKLRAAGWSVDEVACPPVRAAAKVNEVLWMAETDLGSGQTIEDEGEPDAQFVFHQMRRAAGKADLESVMEALKTRAGLVRAWEVFLQDYPVFLCPVSGELPFDQQLDVQSEASFARVYEAQLVQRAFPALGVPALSLATGAVEDRPVGVHLVAAKHREDILFAAGRAIEAACPAIGPVDPAWS
ncbi:MAG: amidase family protein [Pseudomonadota bacterium]